MPGAALPGGSEAREPLGAAGQEQEPEEEASDPFDRVVEAADEAYQQGLEAAAAGDDAAAHRAFNRAVETYLAVGGVLLSEPRLAESFEALLENIHAFEVDRRETRRAPEETPEDLKSVGATLTPEEAEREDELVRRRSGELESDLPVVLNERVLAFIEAFSGPRRKLFEPGLIRSGRYVPMIRRIFQEEGVPRDLCYLAHVESAFKPNAYSRSRAKGLFQFIASTGRHYGLAVDWWADLRADPELSARAAARYLKALYAIYGDWYLAMAEYNGGPRVRRAWQRSGRKADFWQIARSRSLRLETRNYVPQILAAIVLHKAPEKYGLTLERESPLSYDTVPVDGSLDLRVAARLAGTTLEEVRVLNPGLKRLATPPTGRAFPLRLPPRSGAIVLAALDDLPASERMPWMHHRVGRGETLSSIASRYGTTVQAIREANHLQSAHLIVSGQELVIPAVGAGPFPSPALQETPSARSRPAGSPLVHRVRRGDTLQSIARRYRTSVQSLVNWNQLSDPSQIHPGQRLVVTPRAVTAIQRSEPAVSPPPATAAITYRVRSGDTLYSIARRHNVTVDALRRWNGLGGRTLIHPGSELRILR